MNLSLKKKKIIWTISKIQYCRKIIEVRVTSLIDSTKKKDASLMYELVSETNITNE